MELAYWESYKAIAQKLKKRFMRKPKYDVARDEYMHLARELKKEGAHQPAALCFLAVARCQEAMANNTAMAKYTHEAARLYISSVQYDVYSAYLPLADCIVDATNTYLLAVSMYLNIRKPSLASTLLLELAGTLYDLQLFEEAMLYYRKAHTLQQHTPLVALATLQRVASCLIALGHLDVAVNTLTEIIELASDSATLVDNLGQTIAAMRTPRPRNNAAVYEDAIMEAEITRMLLLVHIQPIPTNPDKSYVEMLYAYENDAQPVRDMDLVLYTTLQDVWIARTEGDLQLLLELQGELYMKLTTQQNDILQLIIHGVRHQ